MGDKEEEEEEERIEEVFKKTNPIDPLHEESTVQAQQQQQQQQPITHHSSAIVVSTPSFISTPLYINPNPTTTTTIEPYHHHHHHHHQITSDHQTILNPKRPKYEWKILPSPHHKKSSVVIINKDPQLQTHETSSSTSPTTSSHSPSQSPLQLRKGKYVSPVWKPNEMLWLARAWRIQYQRGGGISSSDIDVVSVSTTTTTTTTTRGKTRAEKDREVAEYLNRNGVNRDAKTSGTKWDNMLGEFRKVSEWERGGEGEQVGKSYFRLSPYERKIHRLPASFDEDVYNELSQFMCNRLRASSTHNRSSSSAAGDHNNGLPSPPPPHPPTGTVITTSNTLPPLPPPPPPPPPFKEDDQQLPLSAEIRSKQGMVMEGGGRGILFGGVFESLTEVAAPSISSATTTSREVRRVGRIRMTWEESLSLWAEDQSDQQFQKGRVKVEGLSFLNADELTFLDESMVGCTMEAFEDGPLKGFSIDRFVCGQQVKVFGRRKSSSNAAAVASSASFAAIPPLEYQDPSDYYLGCLKAATPTTLPTLFELSWHLQEPPPEDLRFPLHKDIYRDLPQGKELFFTTIQTTTTSSSSDQLQDCRAFAFDVLSSILRSNPSLSISTSSSRDSFIPLWDDCINRLVSKFCSLEMVIVRKPTLTTTTENLQDQWPNVTGFLRNFCLWRGEETDQVREGNLDPSTSIVEKVLWTYMDVPYILGYYAVGHLVTFCSLSRSQDRVIRTNLCSVDLSTPTERLKSLIPCWRIGCLLPLLAERCYKGTGFCYSDFERLDLGGGNATEMTPNTVKHLFSSRRKWVCVKEIYDFLDRRIPHSEYVFRVSERDLTLTFKPRGYKLKPTNCEQLVEALKFVTKALVALHDLSFMHRDLCWDKVMRRSDRENEWYLSGFEEAVGAPQIYPNVGLVGPRFAPEMGRGLHGVKVDVWGVGYLIKSSGLGVVPMLLRELQNRCLDQNPEQRPTAADCYHHLLQLQSSLCVAPAAAVACLGGGGGGGY